MSAAIREPHSRLETLASVVTWVFRFAVLATVLRLILALFGQGPWVGAHVGGPSSSPAGVCLDAGQTLLRQVGSGPAQSGLSPGVQASWNSASVCAVHPGAWQDLAFAVTLVPIDLLRLGALYLAQQLARTAARDGVYTAHAARLLLILGWWLLAGGLVATVAEAFARLNLLGQLVTWPVNWSQWDLAWSVSWPVAWIGLGLIVFARVMRIGAGMRADLEGTV